MAPSSLRLGIGFMVAYTLMQSLVWALVRVLSDDLSTETLFFFRNLIGVVSILPLLYHDGPQLFKTRKFSLHFWRAIAAGIGGLALFFAVAHAPLATVVAITFMAPIIASLVAIVIQKEQASRSKLSALGMGFAGVLLVVRPNFDGEWVGIGAAIIGAIATAAAFLLVKTLSATEKAPTTVAFPFLILLPLSGATAIPNWTPLQMDHFPLLLAMGVGFSLGQYAMTKAFHYAEASAVLSISLLQGEACDVFSFNLWPPSI